MPRALRVIRGQATSCDSHKATNSPSLARHPLAHKSPQPFVTLANDRCGTPRAGSFRPGHETRLRSIALIRGALASLPAFPQRLVALRHIVPASSRSFRRVVGSRRVLLRAALLRRSSVVPPFVPAVRSIAPALRRVVSGRARASALTALRLPYGQPSAVCLRYAPAAA
jgi:hypothetical protein